MAAAPTSIRRNILALLAGLSLVSYLLRSNISIAAKFFNGPLVSWLMESWGWRSTFSVTSAFGLLIAAAWWSCAADQPAHHPRVNKAELRAIGAGESEPSHANRPSWRALLRNKTVGLISLSYFLDSFVLFLFIFWFYLYLTDERGFSVLKGGVYNSLPYAFAMVMLPLLGRLCDALALRRGRNRSRRAFAIGCLLSAAAFLFIGANVGAPLPAILCLSLAVGFLISTEGPFWSSTVEAAGAHAGTAGGVMNTAGNLAGVLSTALAPVLVKQIGWVGMFAVCAAMLVAAGLIWMFVEVEQPTGAPAAAANELAVENSV
jgi:ACS family glucarate transporter-like MFS transporter